jgi:hypothetical protein
MGLGWPVVVCLYLWLMGWATRVRSPEDFSNDGVKLMSVEDAQTTLASLEGKLSDAMSRRDKVSQDIAVASAEAAAAHRINPSLSPLNKQAKVIDAEIAIIRIDIRHAQRALELQEDSAERVKDRQAVLNGAAPPRLVQLEIRSPDGRVIRQFHKSVDAARKALQPGYEVTGEVIGSGVVSPVGPGARSFMRALLDAHGDELEAWLAERAAIGSDKTVVVLPSNGREKMQ